MKTPVVGMVKNGCHTDLPGLARAAVQDERGMIPQKHGGALKPAFGPGTGAAAARSSMRAIRKEGLAILAEGTAAASRTLLALLDSDDPRVAAVAASQVLDRTLGKPGENAQVGDGDGARGRSRLNVRMLDADERARLSAALAEISELTKVAAEREAVAEICGRYV